MEKEYAEMDISSQMLLFVTVVERGSFSEAARAVGHTPSAVSKQIAALEDQVRNRLLHRTRSGVTPTQEGQEFYEKCKAMAEKFSEAEALILNLDGTPRGRLKIASSVAFGKSQLIPALPDFLEKHPEVQVSLNLTDRDIDLQAEGFDAAICFAEIRKNPDIMVRKIMHSRRVLCASPAYLEKWGAPKDLSDLEGHNCLGIVGNGARNSWSSEESGADRAIIAEGNFEGNSTDVVYRAALAGIGIARLPCYMTSQKFQTGELVRVLPEYRPPATDIAVMFAAKRNLAPKVRAFIDFLTERFRNASEYDLAS